MVLSALEKTERKIGRVKNKLQQLAKEKDNILSETLVECTNSVLGYGCGQKSMVKDLTYIQTHWYVRPSGCTGGDYWNQGEGQFDCLHCGIRNRLYDKPKIEELKYLFKKTVNEHKD